MPKSLLRSISKKLFIISNVVVAFLFLIGCYGSWFFTNNTWFVGLLTLSVFYFFICLFVFFIFWLLVKPGWSLIFIVTVALAFNPIRKIFPFRFSTPFEIKKQYSDIRVMSWNVSQFDILINKRKPVIRDEMIDLINKYQPDIACFQEMVAADTLTNLNTSYYRKYSFYSVYEFADKLNFPDYFYAYNFKENFFQNQHFGVIIFSKFPIIRKQKISYYPYDYNSSFQYVDVVTATDTLRVFNIHLQSLKFTPENLEYIDNPSIESKKDLRETKSLIQKFKYGYLRRKLQADRIREEIEKSPYRVILCGDFNDVPNSYAYEKIGKGLQNAFVKKGALLGRTFTGISPTLRIDNIFADQQLLIKQFTVVRKKLSDHFPLITDIEVNHE